MSRAHMKLMLVSMVATTVALLVPAAATAKDPAAATPAAHCVVQVLGENADGALSTSEPECYTSSREALLGAAATIKAADDGFSHPMGGSTWVIGKHYDGYNGTGSSITVIGSSCSGGYWNTPRWFDNRISSSYNGCYRLRHYDKPNRGGSSTNTYGVGQIDNLPSWMNNRTESVSYHS